MILNFKAFEKLGYNEDVAKLAEYVWREYKNGNYAIDLSEYSKENLPFFINKLWIETISVKNGTTMTADYDDERYRKTKDFVIIINKFYKPNLPTLEHELKHMYDYLVRGGKYANLKDANNLRPLLTISSDDDIVMKLLYIIYISEMTEIEAFYQGDISTYRNHKSRFKNLKSFIKGSRVNYNLKKLNEYDLDEIFSKLDRNDKIAIINIYNNVDYKLLDYDGLRLKYEKYKKDILNYFKKKPTYSDEQIDRFFNKIKKEVEIKKKVYRKYIERLWSYFNYPKINPGER